MPIISDLTQNQISAIDNSLGTLSEDSNINVYEFGNLILADLLPPILSLINLLADLSGDSNTTTDYSGNSISEQDISTEEIIIEDWSGSSISSTDISIQLPEDSNVNVYEFGNLILADIFPTIQWIVGYLYDMQGSSLSTEDTVEEVVSVSEINGTEGSWVDIPVDSSAEYDFENYTYDNTIINYNGFIPQGVIVDISGS